MLTGQNGILNRATEAKEKTEEAKLKEQRMLDNYEEQITNYAGINWDLAKANAKAPENQKEERNNGVIGIGTDGKAVNMDLWEYALLEDGTYGLNTRSYLVDGGDYTVGYKGGFTNDGRIIGTVPQYISVDNGKIFEKVTDMRETFSECEELKIAPKVPDTVKNLRSTFWGCKNLENAPEIPDGVINMWSTFYGCSSLTEAPKIPNKVENMQSTFMKTAIKKAPAIPDGVINMHNTFANCLNLIETSTIPFSVTLITRVYANCPNIQGEIKINANVTGKNVQTSEGVNVLDYKEALSGAAINGKLKVKGTCPVLDKIVEMANNSNITLE